MNKPNVGPPPHDELSDTVNTKAARKLKARRRQSQNIWSGLGMMGLVGWSVAVPTVLGAALGMWLDGRYPSDISWTLSLLVAGLVLGCVNAWHWVAREEKNIQEGEDTTDE